MELDERLAARAAGAHLSVGDVDLSREVAPVLRAAGEAAALGDLEAGMSARADQRVTPLSSSQRSIVALGRATPANVTSRSGKRRWLLGTALR